jgi:hypothetical protein
MHIIYVKKFIGLRTSFFLRTSTFLIGKFSRRREGGEWEGGEWEGERRMRMWKGYLKS